MSLEKLPANNRHGASAARLRELGLRINAAEAVREHYTAAVASLKGLKGLKGLNGLHDTRAQPSSTAQTGEQHAQ